jgi:hypothetical protein
LSFAGKEPNSAFEEEPGLKEFLRDASLSGNATEDEIEFLRKLRFKGNDPQHSTITGSHKTSETFSSRVEGIITESK